MEYLKLFKEMSQYETLNDFCAEIKDIVEDMPDWEHESANKAKSSLEKSIQKHQDLCMKHGVIEVLE